MTRAAAAEVSPLSLCFADKRVVTSVSRALPGCFQPDLIGIEGSIFDRVRLAVALSKRTGIPCLATEQFVEAHGLAVRATASGPTARPFSLDPNQFAPARRPYHTSRKPVMSAAVVFVETRWNLEHVPANARQRRGDEAVARLTLTRRGNRNLAPKEARDTAERMWRDGGDDGAVTWLGIAAVSRRSPRARLEADPARRDRGMRVRRRQ